MTKKQHDWLEKLLKKEKTRVKLQERENLKRAVLSQVFLDREAHSDALQQGVKQVVINPSTKATQRTHDHDKRNQQQLFDLAEEKEGFVLAEVVVDELTGEETVTAETGEQKNFQMLQAAGRIVESLERRLEMEVDELDEDGEPVMIDVTTATGTEKRPKKTSLFSHEEIKEELYTPLVRRGLIPESNVPDHFSATKEMLDGSYKAYAERLAESKKKSHLISEYKDLAIAGVRSAVSFTGTVQGLDAAFKVASSQLTWTPSTSMDLHGIMQGFGKDPNDSGSGEEWASAADKAAQSWVFVQNASDIAFDLGEEGGEEIVDKAKPAVKNWKQRKVRSADQKNAAKVGGLAVGEIASSLAAALKPYDLDIAAGSTFGALAPGSKIAAAIEEQKIAEVGDALWKAFSDTLTKLVDSNKPAGPAMIAAALKPAKAAFDSAFKPEAVKKSLNDAHSDDPILRAKGYQEAASHLAAGGKAAVDALINEASVKQYFNHIPNAEAAVADAGKVAQDMFKPEPSTPAQSQIDKHGKGHAPEWLRTAGGFECLKCPDGKEDPELFEGILEAKIAQLEADAFIWKWITAIGGMSLDVAADFVQPFAVSGALLRMAKNARAAVGRLNDLYNFLNDKKAMLQAASAFSAPLQQFVTNAEQQLAHYSFNLAMEGFKVIAGVLQMAQITAPAGVGMTGAANALEAAESVLYQAKRVWDLEAAWRSYKKALENPGNRKIALQGIQKNPTLAKYAVAWGAVIKKDPLVADFMTHCGLERDAFKDPNANINLVVKYLEVRMPDDNQIAGRDYSAAGTVEFTRSGWHKKKARAEKKANIEHGNTDEIDDLLQKWEKQYPKLKAAEKRDPKDVAECVKTLESLDKAFFTYHQQAAAEHRKSQPLPDRTPQPQEDDNDKLDLAILDTVQEFQRQAKAYLKEVSAL